MTYYKVLHTDGRCYHGGDGYWHLPTDDGPGEWMPAVKGELTLCNRYKILKRGQVLFHLGPAIFEAEPKGDAINTGLEYITRQARLLARLDQWNDHTARLLAADCAERVLPLFEATFPDDDQLRRVIEAARQYSAGQITLESLTTAQQAAFNAVDRAAKRPWLDTYAIAEEAALAAWSAANSTAWIAARDAIKAAQAATGRHAMGVARASKPIGERNDAGIAAWQAAQKDEFEWQTERLFEYLEKE